MAGHDDRIKAILDAFTQANQSMVARLEALDDAMATQNPPDAWNAAQIGLHTALTTEFLSGALSGGVADMSVPKPDGFTEQLATMAFPDRIKTFPALEPPADTSRADAVGRLRASAATFTKALDTATPERCESTCVQMPFGVFSIYEVGEFVGGHIHRHMGQIDRTVGS